MKTNFKFNSANSFECEINSIFRILSTKASENSVVVRERGVKGGSCKALISVFDRSDLKRQAEEEAEYRTNLRRGADRRSLAKPFFAKPVVRYAFYPSTYNSDKLGSVAIYGDNVAPLYNLINRHRSLFGRNVISADIEMGIRPFLDVRLAA